MVLINGSIIFNISCWVVIVIKIVLVPEQYEGGSEIRPGTNQYIFRSTDILLNLFRTTLILFGTPQFRSEPSTI